MKSVIYYHNRKWLLVFLGLICCFLFSCKKYLDEKPSQNLVVPSTLSDLQGLLDQAGLPQASATSELLTDNFYVFTNEWQANITYSTNSLFECQSYIWDSLAYYPPYWNDYAGHVYFSNIVLDFLPSIKAASSAIDQVNSIRGSALFLRAFAFERLAQLYCRPYSSSASTDLGIVLKLTSDINEAIKRASVQETYDKIIADLKEAAELLPTATLYPTRPNKAAAYAELGRTYLSMRDYTNALLYADSSLQQNGHLIDYNTLVPVGNPPVPNFNVEVDFHSQGQMPSLMYNYAKIDSVLYQSYDNNDLRKSLYFTQNPAPNSNTYKFQGSYDGIISTNGIFNGLTSSEMYLIRAECYARSNNTTAAMADLNALLVTRWKTGTFTQLTATDATDARNKILTERRKELIFRDTRWSDLRRLNLEGANITLKRIINNTTYTLPPNGLRWVELIPQDVINRSGIQQNPR